MSYHTLESRASSDIQTPPKLVKKLGYHLVFNSLLDVWISDETLFLMYDILHKRKCFCDICHKCGSLDIL